ncbi:MAG: HipA domain-containing protein [Rhizobiaceae bacterium]
MSELILDVRLDGYDIPAGLLVRDDFGALSFYYHPQYLADTAPISLSLSMPLTDAPYTDAACRAFFGNLLQERDDTIQRLMDKERIARDDIASLLLHLGKDCPGAISVLAHGAPPAKVPGNFATDYEPLTESELERTVTALHEREPLPETVSDPSPIAGVQSKIALTLLPDGRLAQPLKNSGAPTTHILKVSHKKRPNETKLEAIAMLLSKSLGIKTADAINIEIASVNALLVTRYDRALDANGHIVRLHQEDFAQALGLPYTMKYERNGREGARFDTRAIARIINASATPAVMREQIITATLFDLLIGNVDAHAKNFSLIHSRNGSVEFAPRYDLVPIRMFDEYTDELAYHLGNATTLEDLTAENFDLFLGDLGIASSPARKRLRNRITSSLGLRLADQLQTLSDSGHKKFADLIAANIRHLFREFELQIPQAAKDRDLFSNRGGAWQLPS